MTRENVIESVSQQRRNKYMYVFSLFLNSDEADVTSPGRPFHHTFAPATGKVRPPMVDRRQWRRT